MARKPTNRAGLPPFYKRLILADWLLMQLGVEESRDSEGRLRTRFETLRDPLHGLEQRLKTETGENQNPADGGTVFCGAMLNLFLNRGGVTEAEIRSYDDEIARLWRRITQTRSSLKLKYFQWLALMVNAVYLDRYLRDPDALLAVLNAHRETFNMALGAEAAPPFEREGLNTVSFWCATGSGKTLMMHTHLLQFLAFNTRHSGQAGALGKLDHIFLLTPDSDLSAQHMKEADASGFTAEPFRPGAQLTMSYNEWTLETLENTKIRNPKLGKQEAGPTTFDIQSLQGVNLVLVDEGHLGAGGTTYMPNRRALAENGFCYEYSATFGQIVAANPEVGDVYARNIALDYSYRQFYGDGYGKEFRLFNLSDGSLGEARDEYLCGALLAYDAQLRAYEEGGAADLVPFGFSRPLWVFVGNTVKGADSDVLDILRFVQGFLANPVHYRAILTHLAANQGVLCEREPDLFEGLWTGLPSDGQALYDDIVARVFGGTGTLSIRTGADGEIHLRTGDNAPFGLIHVGEASQVLKAARQDAMLELCVQDDKIAGAALFPGIDDDTSSVRLLVGARKFITGWNAYRVATLGLMKVGRGEGPQIIQLFGRGVRLRGRDNSLMRAAKYSVNFGSNAALKARVERLETLQIFGLQSEYMDTFIEDLRIDVPVQKTVVIEVPVKERDYDPRPALQTLYLPGGDSFEGSGIRFRLGAEVVPLWDGKILKMQDTEAVSHDEYTRLDSQSSRQLLGNAQNVQSNGGENIEKLSAIADRLDFSWLSGQMRRFKQERGYHALQLPAVHQLPALLTVNGGWHIWKVPKHLLTFDGGNYEARRRLWHQSALALLQKYMEWSYKRVKAEYERGKLRLKPFEWEKDRSWETTYTFTISQEDGAQRLRDQLEAARRKIAADDDAQIDMSATFGLRLLDSSALEHLYRPLVVGSGKCWKVTPIALDKNEADFVEKLRAYHATSPTWFQDRELYFLRNKSRVGVGFFEEGGFFPDFLLWIIQGDQQTLVFVDPKGLRNVETLNDPKVTLHHRIRLVEKELGGVVRLRSFLVSNTELSAINWARNMTEATFEAAGVFFQSDKQHVAKLLSAALS